MGPIDYHFLAYVSLHYWCVCVCVMHAHLHPCGEARDQQWLLSALFSCSLPYLLIWGPSLISELVDLAGQAAPGTCLSLPFQSWDYRDKATYPVFSCAFWGSNPCPHAYSGSILLSHLPGPPLGCQLWLRTNYVSPLSAEQRKRHNLWRPQVNRLGLLHSSFLRPWAGCPTSLGPSFFI